LGVTSVQSRKSVRKASSVIRKHQTVATGRDRIADDWDVHAFQSSRDRQSALRRKQGPNAIRVRPCGPNRAHLRGDDCGIERRSYAFGVALRGNASNDHDVTRLETLGHPGVEANARDVPRMRGSDRRERQRAHASTKVRAAAIRSGARDIAVMTAAMAAPVARTSCIRASVMPPIAATGRSTA